MVEPARGADLFPSKGLSSDVPLEYIYIYIQICIYIYIYVYISLYIHMHACMQKHLH